MGIAIEFILVYTINDIHLAKLGVITKWVPIENKMVLFYGIFNGEKFIQLLNGYLY